GAKSCLLMGSISPRQVQCQTGVDDNGFNTCIISLPGVACDSAKFCLQQGRAAGSGVPSLQALLGNDGNEMVGIVSELDLVSRNVAGWTVGLKSPSSPFDGEKFTYVDKN